MNFSFIFIGSTHSFVDDFSKQKEIINLVKPEFVLSEEIENLKLNSKEKLKEILDKKFISNMTPFNEVKKLIRLCLDNKISLIGIDFPNFGFDDCLQEKIKNKKELTKEEEGKLNDLIKKREKYHLSKILDYKEKTNRPLVVILGCWHLRESSLLRKKLKSYKIIAPIDDKGKVLFAPNKNNEIKYGEIISNDTKIEN